MSARVTAIVGEFQRSSGVRQVYLIGSHARGDARADSDIDLVVVDPRFAGKRSFERPLGLRRHWPPGVPVDFICLTPEEFEEHRKRPTLARLAVEEGVAFP